MHLFVTTQSHRNDNPTEYGYLFGIDKSTGNIIKKKRIDTPVKFSDPHERIKPGLRGLAIYQNEIYTTTWNKIYILDESSLGVKQTFSHQWMSDLHGIFVNKNGIWVTSSLPDAVILYDFSGNPISALWLPETPLYKDKSLVDKTIDWRAKGKDFRGFKEYHANHVSVKNGHVFVTGRGRGGKGGRIITFSEKSFLKNQLSTREIKIFAQNLHGPHDGIWCDGNIWITETLGSTIACINSSGKVRKRKKILESEDEKIEYKNLKERIKYSIKENIFKKPGIKMTHWTRGLAIDNDYLVPERKPLFSVCRDKILTDFTEG